MKIAWSHSYFVWQVKVSITFSYSLYGIGNVNKTQLLNLLIGKFLTTMSKDCCCGSRKCLFYSLKVTHRTEKWVSNKKGKELRIDIIYWNLIPVFTKHGIMQIYPLPHFVHLCSFVWPYVFCLRIWFQTTENKSLEVSLWKFFWWL